MNRGSAQTMILVVAWLMYRALESFDGLGRSNYQRTLTQGLQGSRKRHEVVVYRLILMSSFPHISQTLFYHKDDPHANVLGSGRCLTQWEYPLHEYSRSSRAGLVCLRE